MQISQITSSIKLHVSDSLSGRRFSIIKLIIFAMMVFSSLVLAGCAAGANEMTYSPENSRAEHVPKNKQLINNVSVGEVTGGHWTNPLWTSQISNADFKSALEKSLVISHLYHAGPHAKYTLNANLLKLDQPLIGFDLTVSCLVHYQLIENKSKKVVIDENIASTYTAKLRENFVAGIRLKLANEGAARTNIKMIINKL